MSSLVFAEFYDAGRQEAAELLYLRKLTHRRVRQSASWLRYRCASVNFWRFVDFHGRCRCHERRDHLCGEGVAFGHLANSGVFKLRARCDQRWFLQATVASLNLVSGFGGLVAGKVSDAFGRRKTMLVASLLLLGGSILMAIADSFAMLLLGRLITGLGVGAGMVIAPLYLSEFSPPELRGR